jgi:hypothetical protein
MAPRCSLLLVTLCSVFFSFFSYASSLQCGEHEFKFRFYDQKAQQSVCQCAAGYTRQGGICKPCPSGTFKEYVGDSAHHNAACLIESRGCCKCHKNANTTHVAAVHSNQCLCVPGHSGAACRPCRIGSYKQTTSTEHCKLCPEGTTTAQDASLAPADCLLKRT